jgi:predicted Zn-dependent protease
LALYKIDDANVVFHDMLTLDSKSTEAQWGIAEVLYRRHKGAEARTILIELIKATPNYSPAYITLGYVLFNEKKYDEAIELAVRVLKQGPKKVDNDNYVQALLLAGNSKGMIAVDGGPFSKLINGIQVLPYLNKAQKLQPDNAGVAFGLGTYYLLAPSFAGGDKHKALEYLEKSVKLDPQFCDGYARLAQAYKLKGDDVKYDFYIGKALELDPQNGLALDIKKEMSS